MKTSAAQRLEKHYKLFSLLVYGVINKGCKDKHNSTNSRFGNCSAHHLHSDSKGEGWSNSQIWNLSNICCATDMFSQNRVIGGLKGLYHRRVFAVCLQSDPESYERGLSARPVDLK